MAITMFDFQTGHTNVLQTNSFLLCEAVHGNSGAFSQMLTSTYWQKNDYMLMFHVMFTIFIPLVQHITKVTFANEH